MSRRDRRPVDRARSRGKSRDMVDLKPRSASSSSTSHRTARTAGTSERPERSPRAEAGGRRTPRPHRRTRTAANHLRSCRGRRGDRGPGRRNRPHLRRPASRLIGPGIGRPQAWERFSGEDQPAAPRIGDLGLQAAKRDECGSFGPGPARLRPSATVGATGDAGPWAVGRGPWSVGRRAAGVMAGFGV